MQKVQNRGQGRRYAAPVNVERLCLTCGKPLPLTARADRRYHERCRATAYRQRRRERQAAERVAMERAVVDHGGPDFPEVLTAAIAEPRLVVIMAHAARQTAGNLATKSRSTLTRMGLGTLGAGPVRLVARAAAQRLQPVDRRDIAPPSSIAIRWWTLSRRHRRHRRQPLVRSAG
jgi:hypothetical protein